MPRCTQSGGAGAEGVTASKKQNAQGRRRSLRDLFRRGRKQQAPSTLDETATTPEDPLISSSSNSSTTLEQDSLVDSRDNQKAYCDDEADNNGSTPPATERSCPVCCAVLAADDFPTMTLACTHSTCRSCLETYFKQEIMESRTGLKCPQCENEYEAHDITRILSQSENPVLVDRYLEFTLRRSLASMPDIRWCPAPDCGYGVIANNCASCPKLTCKRPECGTTFCYLCETEWHPCETCVEAFTRRLSESMETAIAAENAGRNARSAAPGAAATSSLWKRRGWTSHGKHQYADEGVLLVKLCPSCRTKICLAIGSCNELMCPQCLHSFCWLCLQSLMDDLHFFSASGCTYFGSRTWSRPSTVAAQLLTVAGAPLVLAAVTVAIPPLTLIYFPAILVYFVSTSGDKSPARKCLTIVWSAVAGLLLSPIVAALGIVLAIPLGLVYAYGYMPYKMIKRRKPSPHRFGIDVDDAELCLYTTDDPESDARMLFPP
eukprot:scpid56223/ scgid21180/ E3 ubiquitin-protein ligase RNF19B; IBR domain-containing protein 3; Natural killer lytic-associated molecule; RING finger protein 19B